MTDGTTIRTAGEADFDALTELWERAARPTHPFMSEDAFADQVPRIRDLLLPSMDVLVAVDGDTPLGFVGSRDGHVELLYVAPEAQGHGIGPALLARIGPHGATSVEVYAENVVGLGFYHSQGFVETRRDPIDVSGRGHPIAHLERPAP